MSDDTATIQQMLDDKVSVIPPGTYTISSVKPPSGTRCDMSGVTFNVLPGVADLQMVHFSNVSDCEIYGDVTCVGTGGTRTLGFVVGQGSHDIKILGARAHDMQGTNGAREIG